MELDYSIEEVDLDALEVKMNESKRLKKWWLPCMEQKHTLLYRNEFQDKRRLRLRLDSLGLSSLNLKVRSRLE